MIIDLKVPSPGESINEVEIANWLKQEGDYVEKDEELCEIDSDKATLTINAEASGKLSIKVTAGTTVSVGDVIATIDTSAEGAPKVVKAKTESAPAPAAKLEEKPAAAPASASYATGTPSPAAAKIMTENNIKSNDVKGSGPAGRITKGDVNALLASGFGGKTSEGNRSLKREKMTSLRKKISQR